MIAKLKLSRQQLILGIIALGIFFLSLSYFISRDEEKGPSGTRIATVIHETGKVEVIRAGFSQRSKVETRADLSTFDSVETFEIGEANLIFENGYHLRVFENSLLTLERVNDPENYHVLLVIKRGDVRVDQLGREGELFISKNGQRILAAKYNDSELKRHPPQSKTEETDSTSHAPSLTEEEIANTMNNNKNRFFRCYSRLVQNNPQVKGDVSLAFTIENSGHPNLLEINIHLTPKVSDEDFKKCLKDVITRIEFKPFTGPTVSTVFPLKFD
jgi:hypothetical protein